MPSQCRKTAPPRRNFFGKRGCPLAPHSGTRVHLAGERRIDIAQACGYGDGSAITQILKRLGIRAQSNPAIRKRLSCIEAEFNRILSCVRRCPLSAPWLICPGAFSQNFTSTEISFLFGWSTVATGQKA